MSGSLIGLVGINCRKFCVTKAGKWLNETEILKILKLEKFHERAFK
jgi:hypothetical protein